MKSPHRWIAIILIVVLGWFGFKWFFSENGPKKVLGGVMIIILTVDLLNLGNEGTNMLDSAKTSLQSASKKIWG